MTAPKSHLLRLVLLLMIMAMAPACGAAIPQSPPPSNPPAEAGPTSTSIGPRRPTHDGPLVGVFRQTSQDRVEGFETWYGNDVDLVIDYASDLTWDQIANPDYLLEEWQGSPYRLVYGVPMLPAEEAGTFAAGAAGAYDEYFHQLAVRLVETGQADAILRIGLEFNVHGSRWAVASPEEYVSFWRRIVTVMRSVPGQQFLMDWNPGNGSQAGDGPAYYPGDDVVDIVSVDTYDLTGGSGAYPYPKKCDDACRRERQDKAWKDEVFGSARGLKFWSDFARQHNKPMSLPEWGLWNRPDGTGGGENPSFIRRMHKFIMDPANNVMYHAYFDFNGEQGEHSLMETFHESGDLYRRLFR